MEVKRLKLYICQRENTNCTIQDMLQLSNSGRSLCFRRGMRNSMKHNTGTEQTASLLFGDFNARVGNNAVSGAVGVFGEQHKNSNGDSLIRFATSLSLIHIWKPQ